MSNELSNDLKAQLFKQEAEDPYLTLLTIEGSDGTYRLVNNTRDFVSRGQTFVAFPMKVRMPVDDGESAREFQLDFDNASLLLIRALRSVTEPIPCKVEMVLASMPDVVQSSVEDLLIKSVSYNAKQVTAKIVLDNFLAVAMTSESYTPSLYPGLF